MLTLTWICLQWLSDLGSVPESRLSENPEFAWPEGRLTSWPSVSYPGNTLFEMTTWAWFSLTNLQFPLLLSWSLQTEACGRHGVSVRWCWTADTLRQQRDYRTLIGWFIIPWWGSVRFHFSAPSIIYHHNIFSPLVFNKTCCGNALSSFYCISFLSFLWISDAGLVSKGSSVTNATKMTTLHESCIAPKSQPHQTSLRSLPNNRRYQCEQ